jgi:hypothetical protein
MTDPTRRHRRYAMSAPFILINEYTIAPGKTGEFLEGFQKIADIAEAHEPELLYFAEHVSEDGGQGSLPLCPPV